MPKEHGAVVTPLLDMLLGTAWLSPQTPLPFEAHQSTPPSLRTFPHLMHLPIPNMTFPPTTVLEDTESPPACILQQHRCQPCSLSEGQGCHQELALPGSSGSHHPARLLPCSAADRSQVRQSQAFSWTASDYRTNFALGKFCIQD